MPMQLIKTETVTVQRKTVAYDELGEIESEETVSEDVQCIVEPGSSSDLDATRPNGVLVSFTVHFPKAYKASLRGALLVLRGETYSVVGNPQGYTEANTPGLFNRTVEVSATDG